MAVPGALPVPWQAIPADKMRHEMYRVVNLL